VKSVYSWEVIASSTIEVYNEVIKSIEREAKIII